MTSLRNGWSYEDIANALRDEGHYVGNEKNTGFLTALKRVAGRKAIDLDEVKRGEEPLSPSQPAARTERRKFPEEPVPEDTGTPVDPPSNVSPPAPPPFGDTRFSSDF